ncbi:MAG TPA: hypothetical protein VFQ41_19660 [Candidatus Angelobacter sp.]|nr:hypothetical protein [Candidatus Angelobacter sp.]
MQADFSVELGRDDAALELPWSFADPAVRYYDLKKHPELLREIPEAVAHPELGAFLARINAAGFPLATAKCDAWASREVTPEEEIFGDRKFVSYVDLIFEDETQRCSFERHEAFAKNLCRLLSQTPEIPAAVELVIRRCYYHGKSFGAEAADAAEESGFEAEGGAGAADEDAVESEFEAEGRGEAVEFECEAEGAAGVGAADDAGDAPEVGNQVELGRAVLGGGEAPAEDIHVTDLASGPRGLADGFCFTAYVTGFGDGDHEPGLRWQIALALLQNALVQLAR